MGLLLALVMVASSSRGDSSGPMFTTAPAVSNLQGWQASASYSKDDIVEYQGHLYKAAAPNTNSPPGAGSMMWSLFDPSSGAPGASGDLSQVTPVVDCIYGSTLSGSLTTAHFVAVFGYVNNGTTTVVAPFADSGPQANAINGHALGQPISFAPGTHDAVFTVDSAVASQVTSRIWMTWTLGGRSVTAGSATPTCTTTQGPDGPVATVNGASILVQPDPSAILSAAMPIARGDKQTIVGATQGGLQVGSDGSANYSIPLWTPPARMGIGPSLSLAYSGHGGRGLLGGGWTVAGFGLSRITRCQKTIAEDGDAPPISFGSDDAFCLDGARLLPTSDPAVNGKTVYQTEHDPFTRVLFDTQALTWEVDQPNGRVLTYGSNIKSRHINEQIVWVPGNGDPLTTPPVNIGSEVAIYAWGLDSVTDPSGNQMTVSYQHWTDTQGALEYTPCTELLPQQISYTASATNIASRTVVFAYENGEPNCHFVSGFGVGAQARLTTITMQGPGTTGAPTALRWYTMAYHQSVTGRSLLDSVQECAPGLCKPRTRFTYEPGYGTTFAELPASTTASLSYIPNLLIQATAIEFADLNNDGKDDVIFQGYQPPGGLRPVEGYALNDGTKFGPPQIPAQVATHMPAQGFLPIGMPFAIGPSEFGDSSRTRSFLNAIDVPSCMLYNAVKHRCIKTQDAGSMGLYTLDLANNVLRDAGTRWLMSAPFFVGDFDGDGSSDLLATVTGSNNVAGWQYWLNNNPHFPGTASKTAKAVMSAKDDAHYAYTAHVDGSPKTAFLARTGGGTNATELPTLFAMTADAASGDLNPRTTTLPTGAYYTLEAPPNCTPSDADPCTPVIGWSPGTFRYIFLDLNGDGNDDAIQVLNNGGAPTGVSLNVGTGFGPLQPLPGVTTSASFNLPSIASTTATPVSGMTRVADLNGDGLPDLLIANAMDSFALTDYSANGGPLVAYLSNGTGGVTAATLVEAGGSVISQGGANFEAVSEQVGPPPTPWGVDVLDFDGDGRTDIYAGGHIYLQEGNKPDLLTTVTDGLGNTTSITNAVIGRDDSQSTTMPLHSPSANCQYPKQCLTKGQWVVSRVQTPGDIDAAGKGVGQGTTIAYQYQGGQTDLRGRGWLGFSQMTTTNVGLATSTTTTFYDPGIDTGAGYPLAGAPFTTTTTGYALIDGGGQQHLQTSTTSYEVITTLGGAGAVRRVTSSESQLIETTGSYTATLTHTKTVYGYDASTAPFNLNAETTTWIESGETSAWTGTYASNTTNGKWLLSMPLTSATTSTVPGQAPVTRTKSFKPDLNTGLVQVAYTEQGASPDLASSELFDRDANGQIIHTRVAALDPLTSAPLAREVFISYDSDGIFPEVITNALGRQARAIYHTGLGARAWVQDQNGVTAHTTFDTFGRTLSETADGGTTTTYAYGAGVPYAESGAVVPGLFTVTTDVVGGGHSAVTYNSLGHEVVRGVRNHDKTTSYTETGYSGVTPGQVATVALPHAYVPPNVYSPPNQTSYYYDLLGRHLSTQLPDHSLIVTHYLGRATSVIDPRGYARTKVVDDAGHLVRLDEDDQGGVVYPDTAPYQRPNTAIATNYTHGAFGQVTEISVTARASQGGATTTLSTMSYDTLGRRTSLFDADSGLVQTTYNAFGETTSQTDANGDVIIPARDLLGRLVAEYSSRDGATFYQWDTAPGGIGQLGSATSPDQVTTQYAYDTFGRPTTTTWSIPSIGSFAMTTGYDSYGRTASLAYPTTYGVSIQFGYDWTGAVNSVTTPEGELAWQAMQWQADGRNTVEQYGSAAMATGTVLPEHGTTVRQFDSQRGWVRSIQTTNTAGASIQNLTYDYDLSGNLKQRTDGVGGTRETFTNDFLNRIMTWSFVAGSSQTSTTYEYTDLGNLSVKEVQTGTGLVVPTFYASGTRDAGGTPGTAGVHAITASGADSYQYDANGSQTAGAGRSIGYTSFHLPKSIETASGTTTFLYDAGHRRVLKKGPSGTTVYIAGLYEKRIDTQNNATDVFYVPGGNGHLVAQEQLSEAKPTLPRVYYFHQDHLGSIESVTGYWDNSGFFKGVGVVTIPNELGVQRLKYDPFGQRIDPSSGAAFTQAPGDITTGFTEQEHDDELGLIDMHGRIYDPKVARFLSSDPIAHATSQGLNAYSYVGNNPLNFTDPSGFDGKRGSDQNNCPSPTQNTTAGDTIPGCAQNGAQPLGLAYAGTTTSTDDDFNTCTASGVSAEECSSTVWLGPKSPEAPPPPPPPTNDSNGPGAFGGSTTDQLVFYAGQGPGRCMASCHTDFDPHPWGRADSQRIADASNGLAVGMWNNLIDTMDFLFGTQNPPEMKLGPALKVAPPNSDTGYLGAQVGGFAGLAIPGLGEEELAEGLLVEGGEVWNARGGIDFSRSTAFEGQVQIQYTGSRMLDYQAANRAAGLGDSLRAPPGFLWHHLDDYSSLTNTGTMQLVEAPYHVVNPHYGGVAQWVEFYGVSYKP